MNIYENQISFPDKWLSKIPAHWQTHKMKRLFDERSEKGYPQEPLLVASQNKGVIPKAMYGTRTVEAQKDLHLLKRVHVGDFVISLRSFQGGLEYAYYQGIISPAYTILVPHAPILATYFRYLAKCKPFIGLLTLCVTGIREGQNVDYTKLRNHILPLPPRAEQDQIVRFLDWKVSEINKLIGIRKKEISELESLKLCHMTNVITKGLNNDIQKKSTSSKWIGDIPTHWDLVAVRRVYKVILGKMLAPNRNTNSDKLEEYICAKDVHFDGITLSDLKKMWFSKFEREQYRVGDGDLLVVEGGAGAGNAALLDKKDKKDVYVQNSVHIIRAKDDKAINSYLCFWLFSLVKRGYMESVCSVATIPHYTKDKVLSTVMPLPPLAEQQKIVEHLEKYSAEINALILKNKNTINEMLELKNTIISDVVTGKIDVRNVAIPAYEHIDDAADAGDGEESAEELAAAEEMEA